MSVVSSFPIFLSVTDVMYMYNNIPLQNHNTCTDFAAVQTNKQLIKLSYLIY